MSEEFPCKYCQNAKCAIEMIRLRALNAEMLEGLKRLYKESHTLPSADMCDLIEKAEEFSKKNEREKHGN